MSISSAIQNVNIRSILINSISCGDTELAGLLEQNIDTAILINGNCYEEIGYLQTQLSLIDIALNYTRNRVDTANTRARSVGFDQYRAKYKNESMAQRSTQMNSCSFADATSFQQFQRDSVNASRSQSDMESNSTGTTQTTMWDRSTQDASGYSVVSDSASSSSDGEGRGSSVSTTSNGGRSYSKTSPDFGPNLNDTFTGFYFPEFIPEPQDVVDAVSTVFGWVYDLVSDSVFERWTTAGRIALQIGQFIPPAIDAGLFNDPIEDSYVSQNVENVNLNDPFLDCCCNLDGNPLTDCDDDDPLSCNYDYIDPFPSYGRGFQVNYQASIGIPFIATLTVTWQVGQQFKQSDVMTQGCTRAIGAGSTSNIYEQLDQSQSQGSTDTRDESITQRDIHTAGDSFEDSRSDTTAGSASTGDAHSESHTGSDRLAHSQNRSSGQGTAWSKSTGRGSGLSTSDSESKTEVRHWSQIFKHLSQMYDRIFDQIKSYTRIRTITNGGVVGPIAPCNRYSLPADPIILARNKRRDIINSTTKRYVKGC